jgi:hypothetical protein
MDARAHKRFLDYRERFTYFAKETRAQLLLQEQFVSADAERQSLEEKGAQRDDEEEARFAELTKLLFLD